MRVLLKMTLNCTPDAAWQALTSPAAFRAVSAPFTSFTSSELNGFPEHWPPGEHRVVVSAFGLVPIGEQLIDVSFEQRGDVRIFHDDGRGLSGALTLATGWHHSMALSALPGGRTLYRDELRFEGPVVLWAAYWAFWQWRGIRIRQLARHWR